MANQAHNVLPLFSSSTSRRWRGAPHQAIILIVHKQWPNPPWRSLASFSLGARLLLLLDLYGRFPSPLPGLFYYSVLPRIRTRPPADSAIPDRSSSTRILSFTSILCCWSSIVVFAAGSNRLLEVLQMAGGRSGLRNK